MRNARLYNTHGYLVHNLQLYPLHSHLVNISCFSNPSQKRTPRKMPNFPPTHQTPSPRTTLHTLRLRRLIHNDELPPAHVLVLLLPPALLDALDLAHDGRARVDGLAERRQDARHDVAHVPADAPAGADLDDVAGAQRGARVVHEEGGVRVEVL